MAYEKFSDIVKSDVSTPTPLKCLKHLKLTRRPVIKHQL